MGAAKSGSSSFVRLLLTALSIGVSACASVKPVQAPLPISPPQLAQVPTAPPLAISAYRRNVSLLVGLRSDGTVADATIKHSAGDVALDQVAVDTAKRWPFSVDAVQGLAKGSLAHVSMTLDVPLQPGPGCSPATGSQESASTGLRFAGSGLRANSPDNAPHAIYLTVLSDGCGASTLSAVWRYNGTYLKPQLVNRTQQNLVANGPATTVFSVKNPHQWPFGSYQVDVEVNDLVVATTHFVIDEKGLSVSD